MKPWFRQTAGVMAAVFLTLCPALPVSAAQSSVIENVSVTFKTEFGDPEEILEPLITVGGTGCTLGDVQYMTDYDRWKPGTKVRFEITVLAEEGKHFPVSLNRSQCKVSGATYVSAKALDDGSLQVKVDYKPITVLGDTERAGWSSSGKRAVWRSVDYAPGYNLVLYGDGKIVKRMTVSNNNTDLTPYMEDMDKTYYYEVKAVPITSEDRKYFKEGNFVTSTDQIYDWEEAEKEEEKLQGAGDGGEFRGDTYVMPDGSKAVNSWKKVGGKWYYFDGGGNRARGWLNLAGIWYYMDQDGVMCTGWIDLNGNWFYLGTSGDMRTGWFEEGPGNRYYMNQDGYMVRNWVAIDGKWYYFDQSGRMQTGWLQNNNKWYYLMPDGAMAVHAVVDGWVIGGDGVANR